MNNKGYYEFYLSMAIEWEEKLTGKMQEGKNA